MPYANHAEVTVHDSYVSKQPTITCLIDSIEQYGTTANQFFENVYDHVD